jgi:hypothetical protein
MDYPLPLLLWHCLFHPYGSPRIAPDILQLEKSNNMRNEKKLMDTIYLVVKKVPLAIGLDMLG